MNIVLSLHTPDGVDFGVVDFLVGCISRILVFRLFHTARRLNITLIHDGVWSNGLSGGETDYSRVLGSSEDGIGATIIYRSLYPKGIHSKHGHMRLSCTTRPTPDVIC